MANTQDSEPALRTWMKARQMWMYTRYAMGLPRFLRAKLTLADAEALVRDGMQRREANFLRLLQQGVFEHPRSPYAKLLRLARCEFGDAEALVRQKGLEGALLALRAAGVFVTFDELKGRAPIVRHGASWDVRPSDFENPWLSRAYEATTGGSTGAGSRVSVDLDHLAAQSAHLLIAYTAHGTAHVPHALWRPTLPAGSGINNILRGAHHGHVPEKWFTPDGPDYRPPLRFRLATAGTVLLGRLCGTPIPWPEYVPMQEAVRIARWAADAVRAHGACQINAPVSRALRICIAAQDHGVDLTGVVFCIAGEPPSPAKVAGILASGARHFTTYGFAEGGRVAIGCVNPSTHNDLHLLRDAFAAFSFPRHVAGLAEPVPALNITSLLFTTPLILLNAEIDDFGILEARTCGCPLERYGYNLHVRDIASYRKLTGEGVTLVGSEMIEILERVLPARFGGTPLDYQLMEEEDPQGFTRLSIRMSPSLPEVAEADVIGTVMTALHESSVMADNARATWAQAGSLRVVRQEPVWTQRGKLLPLYIARRTRDSERAHL